jgi:hypothetical protein
MPPVLPAGSRVVLLDGTAVQVPLASSMIGASRVLRFGPARRPPDDPSFRQVARVFRGIGLRPYAPVHLRARRRDAEGIDFTWIRRTRIDGDRWDMLDAPLGETAERYRLRVISGGVVRRDVEVGVPFWRYADAARAGDGVTGTFAVEVAQMSDRFGPGLHARISIDE